MADPIYKVLDCQRKGILGLPSGAVHVWLACWMHESEDNESYLSTRTLAAITKMDRNTAMKWQRYLIANGWLKLTGGSAADKYENPTRGASKVLTMRVDDPLKVCLAEKTSHEEGGGIIQPESGGNLIGGKIQPKVYGSVSVSNSRCVTVPCTTPAVPIAMSSPEETFSLRSNDEGQNQEQHQGQNQNQKQNPRRSASAVKPHLKQSPKYDSPFPAAFDAWSVQARAEWVEAHSIAKAVSRVPAPIPVEQPVAAPVEPKPVRADPEVQPPNAALPPTAKPQEPVKPAPVEIDYKLEIAKKLARNINTVQTYYNAKEQPPADWETVWVAESAALVELVDGADRYLPRWHMLDDVIVLSQVKYATKYTSPALIAEHIPELAEEVLALRSSDEFDAMWDMYLKALGGPMKNDDECDADSLERKALD